MSRAAPDAAAAATAPGGMRLLTPLRLREFRLLWTGMSLSLLGDGVLLVALAWQTYELSNSPAAMSLIGVCLTLPQVVLLLLGGVVADRCSRRRVMLVADAVRGASLAVLAVLSIGGGLALWHLAALAAVYGAASGFFMPAFDALVPEIVGEQLLTEANSLDQVIRPVALWLLGPALGGVGIAVVGVGWAFAFDAATFAVSVACLLRMPQRPAEPGEALSVRAAARELREGFAFVRHHRWLWATFLAATFTYLLFLGPTEVLLPYLVKNDLGGDAHDLGVVLAAAGVGALLAALVIGHTGLPRRVMTFTYLAWALATLAIAGYGLARSGWQLMAVAAFVSGCEAAGAVAWTTTKQRLVPAALLGRVSAFDWFISTAALPLSYALTAPVAAALGTRATLVGAGVLGACVTLAVLFVPGVRDPERVPPSPAPPSPVCSPGAAETAVPA
jgi:MFS family permease